MSLFYLNCKQHPKIDIRNMVLSIIESRLLSFFHFFKKKKIFLILICRHIDANEAKYIQRLSDAVAIKSVSAWPETRQDIVKMMEFTKAVS